MSDDEQQNVSMGYLQRKLEEANSQIKQFNSSGGGDMSGGSSGGLDSRVSALEAGQKRIEDKLDKIGTQAAELKGQLTAMPSASTFGDIKGALGKLEGRVESLPTTAKLATMLAIMVAVITIITKWTDLTAALKHP